MFPKTVFIVAGAFLLVLMYVRMFWASCRYSFFVSVPGVVVSVPVVGCLTVINGVVVLSVLFILMVVCVSSWRKVAWFTLIPLMVMYSGRYLFPSRNFSTSIAD